MLNLNPLPEWKDRFKPGDGYDENEQWKWKEELQAAEPMYNQWRELFGLVMAFAENLPDEEDEIINTRNLIYENAFKVAPKIMSATGDTLYQIKMENAALIRFNSRQMLEQVGWAVTTGKADDAHKKVIEASLKKFKQLFRHWVNTFQQDDFEDDWGLF